MDFSKWVGKSRAGNGTKWGCAFGKLDYVLGDELAGTDFIADCGRGRRRLVVGKVSPSQIQFPEGYALRLFGPDPVRTGKFDYFSCPQGGTSLGLDENEVKVALLGGLGYF